MAVVYGRGFLPARGEDWRRAGHALFVRLFWPASLEADIYFAAFVVPDFLKYLPAGAYFSITLILLFSSRFEKDEADGWRFPFFLSGGEGLS